MKFSELPKKSIYVGNFYSLLRLALNKKVFWHRFRGKYPALRNIIEYDAEPGYSFSTHYIRNYRYRFPKYSPSTKIFMSK